MSEPETTTEQKILDLRMEYPLLVSASISVGNMYWLGYGAFFTINTLLATALGLSYSERSNLLSADFLKMIHVCIPITGIFISMVAIKTTYHLFKIEKALSDRGLDIEKILHTRIFSVTNNVGLSWSTVIGSILFAVMWMGVLYSVIQ